MANQLYGGHNTSSYSAAYASSRSAAAVDPYLPTEPSLRYHHYPLSSSYSDRYSSSTTTSAAAAAVAAAAEPTPSYDPLTGGLKRTSESLYHPTLLGAYSTIGQSDAWYSTNPLVKRPRFETTSSLSIYPQRPGEKDCAHYMLTRTCKFGDTCKFDHPIWVPEGGIPDWKEVPVDAVTETYPERPGEPDCPYFVKTQKCKYGLRCKFNHPKDKMATLETHESAGFSSLPDRPSEPPCAFYMKTGICKFGATCKFHHPRDIQLQPAIQATPDDGQNITASADGTIGQMSLIKPVSSPALFHNTKGLPVRLGEADCPFYLKTGSCKYGATCRYNHPDRFALNLPVAAVGNNLIPSAAANFNIGVVNPAASILQIDPRFTQTLGLAPTMYPQRPGQIECDFYMKTGVCKFGERCRFHHPLDRSTTTPSTTEAQQQNVKLTLAGLPRREGSVHCPYYMKTGTCKYGATCKFDHPPPGEVMAMATSTTTAGEEKEDEEQ